MDFVCTGISPLSNFLYHTHADGPFSHAYEEFLKQAYKNEKENPDQYEERNRKFQEEFGMEMPPLKEKYDHEDTSLMMIDFALSCVGLEIDWDNLDKPLKQIGDGTDAERFGVVLGGDKYDPLTSRDWIFIKEVRVGVVFSFGGCTASKANHVLRICLFAT